jgi:hypothetical protein
MALFTGSEQNLADYRGMRDDAKKRARKAFARGDFADMKDWSRQAAQWTLLVLSAQDIRRENEELRK